MTDASSAPSGTATTGVLLWQQHDPNNANPYDGLHWGCSANPKGSFSRSNHHWVVNDYTADVYVVVSTEKVTLNSCQFLFGVNSADAVTAKSELGLQRNFVASYFRLPPSCALKVYPGTNIMIFADQTDVEVTQGPGPIHSDWSITQTPGAASTAAPFVVLRPAHEPRE